jgi:hypothetical protein
MKTLLMCHHDAPLDHEALAGWMASFSDLVGVVVVRETSERMKRRVKRELERVGRARFCDVLAFRLYYKAVLSGRDREWEKRTLADLRARYPLPPGIPRLETSDPNAKEVAAFLREQAPDLMIARVKSILKESIFGVPKVGTFVMHPGICPEYRNAHGCFWALAQGDTNKVGMTLLRIDKGVDTGPVFGYFTYPYDAARESHHVIQGRVVLDNLDAIRDKLVSIANGSATPLKVEGRPSATWGQPWLSRYLRWRINAKLGRNQAVPA